MLFKIVIKSFFKKLTKKPQHRTWTTMAKKPLSVSEVFALASEQKTKKEVADVLKNNKSDELLDILRGTFDTNIEFVVPDDSYEELLKRNIINNTKRQTSHLSVEREHFNKFREKKLKPAFVEQLYIDILESIDEGDAKAVVDMIRKEPPAKITLKVIEQAFPGFIKSWNV